MPPELESTVKYSSRQRKLGEVAVDVHKYTGQGEVVLLAGDLL